MSPRTRSSNGIFKPKRTDAQPPPHKSAAARETGRGATKKHKGGSKPRSRKANSKTVPPTLTGAGSTEKVAEPEKTTEEPQEDLSSPRENIPHGSKSTSTSGPRTAAKRQKAAARKQRPETSEQHEGEASNSSPPINQPVKDAAAGKGADGKGQAAKGNRAQRRPKQKKRQKGQKTAPKSTPTPGKSNSQNSDSAASQTGKGNRKRDATKKKTLDKGKGKETPTNSSIGENEDNKTPTLSPGHSEDPKSDPYHTPSNGRRRQGSEAWVEPTPLPEKDNHIHPVWKTAAERTYNGLRGYTGQLTSPTTRGIMPVPQYSNSGSDLTDDQGTSIRTRRKKEEGRAGNTTGPRKKPDAEHLTASTHWLRRPKGVTLPEPETSAMRSTAALGQPIGDQSNVANDPTTAQPPSHEEQHQHLGQKRSAAEADAKSMRKQARFDSSSMRLDDILTEELNKGIRKGKPKFPKRKSGARKTDILRVGSISQSSSSRSGSKKSTSAPTQATEAIDNELEIARHRSGRPSVAENKGKSGFWAWLPWAMQQKLKGDTSPVEETNQNEQDS